MSEFFFVIKISVITVLLVILMQVRWDNKTIESHIYSWAKTSSILNPVRGVSEAGLQLIRSSYDKTTRFLGAQIKSKKESSRKLFEFERSKTSEETNSEKTEQTDLTELNEAGF